MFVIAFIMLFLLLGFSNFYIAKRLHAGISCIFPKTPFWAVFAPLLTFAGIAVFNIISPPLPDALKTILQTVSAYWMAIFVYLFLLILLADLITLTLKLFNKELIKKKFFKLVSLICVISITLVTVIFGSINAYQVDHISYEITIENRTDISDLNIVLISDLHLGSMGSEARLEKIVGEINSLNPDLVCIAGDFFDTNFSAIKNPNKAIKNLKKISSTYGVFACLGNHDAGKTLPQMQSFLKDSNITLLKEHYQIIDNRLILVGRLDSSPIGNYGKEKRKEFNQIISNTDKNLPIIVLDHNPKNIAQYKSNADLILCGHTHKGQMFPLNLFTSLIYELDYGHYKNPKNDVQAIITSGVGYWGPPVRVGTNSEIVSIKILSK